ncbi:hypothetical protein BC938DRAFT_471044 [Jimgerdemannia flammicorona]|uniref:Uncharacterized protein n=1 Tax=Jimgerdemannia flammicorona TaxID=994334 RepID=A0A433Q8Y2_9FUNG|nr:hypothetical protein BC938DRAFT_471044 [Jimgerdemannia flammicorona]
MGKSVMTRHIQREVNEYQIASLCTRPICIYVYPKLPKGCWRSEAGGKGKLQAFYFPHWGNREASQGFLTLTILVGSQELLSQIGVNIGIVFHKQSKARSDPPGKWIKE